MKHRFFVHPDQILGERVIFSEPQARQINNVLRLRKGDAVRVFDGEVLLDRVVELIGPGEGCITGAVQQPCEPATRLVMYPALLQREKFEQVLQKLTELGAAAVVPVITARCLVRQPPDDHRQTRWRAILREAAEQSGRGVVPTLGETQSFPDAIRRASEEGTPVMAFEGEHHQRLRDALAAAQPTVGLFVGPEGGFEPEEADCARRGGAHLVTLGPRVLRTETASVILAALALYERELR